MCQQHFSFVFLAKGYLSNGGYCQMKMFLSSHAGCISCILSASDLWPFVFFRACRSPFAWEPPCSLSRVVSECRLLSLSWALWRLLYRHVTTDKIIASMYRIFTPRLSETLFCSTFSSQTRCSGVTSDINLNSAQ